MEPDHVRMCRALTDAGMEGFPGYDHIATLLSRDNVPELGRCVLFSLQLPTPIWMLGVPPYAWGMPTEWSQFNRQSQQFRHALYNPKMENFSPEQQRRIVVWASNAVRSHRMISLAVNVVHRVLERCGTVGALHATMKILTTLPVDADWREKLRSPPRHPGKYLPFGCTPDTPFGKQIVAVSAVIAGAQLLESYTRPAGTIAATLKCFEPLETDRAL